MHHFKAHILSLVSDFTIFPSILHTLLHFERHVLIRTSIFKKSRGTIVKVSRIFCSRSSVLGFQQYTFFCPSREWTHSSSDVHPTAFSLYLLTPPELLLYLSTQFITINNDNEAIMCSLEMGKRQLAFNYWQHEVLKFFVRTDFLKYQTVQIQ